MHFLDRSVKAFAVTPATTAAEFRMEIAQRLNLQVHETFSLFEVKEDWGELAAGAPRSPFFFFFLLLALLLPSSYVQGGKKKIT